MRRGCGSFHDPLLLVQIERYLLPGRCRHPPLGRLAARASTPIFGSNVARIAVTIVAGSGLAMTLHHGGMTLDDGALHSTTAKVVAILLMGATALWHAPANIWYKRTQSLASER